MSDTWVYVAMVMMLGLVIFNIEHKQNKQTRSIGSVGEQIVADRLSNLGEEFVVENDVYFGKTQIDHLVINHELEICFVIETKIWGGVITGSSNDMYWQQDKNGVIKHLANPLNQNKYHCSVVRKYYPGYKVYNVVVMVRNKNVPSSRCIMNENGLVDYINKTSNKVSNRGRIDIQSDWLSYSSKV